MSTITPTYCPHISQTRTNCPHTYGVRVCSCAAFATEPCRPTACISRAHSPAVPCPLTPVPWTFTFSAKERDSETGLSVTSLRSVSSSSLSKRQTCLSLHSLIRRFGSRYYNSDLSIWLSVDPMSDKYPSLSPYVYCANNPVKLVDPNGEEFGWVEDNDGNVFWDNNTNSADEFEQNYKGKTGYSYVSDEENYRSYTLPNGDGKVVLNKWNEGKVTDGYATPEIELEYIPSNPNVTSGWFQTYSSNIPDANSGNDNYILPGADVENRIDFQTVDRTITSVGYWNPADNANVLKDMPRRRFNDGAERSVIWNAESSVLVNGKRSFTISWGFSIDSDRSGYYTSPRIENKPSYFHLNTIQLVK